MTKLKRIPVDKLSKKPKGMDESGVPIIRSLITLRKEYFGGLLFNSYLPPEIRLDRIRFKIATLCDGGHTLGEIKNVIGNDLDHTKEYTDELVNRSIITFNKCFAVFWLKEKLENPEVHTYLESKSSDTKEDRLLSAPLFVIWEITSACNLKCKHCLSNSGKPHSNELSTKEAKKLIDSLEKMKVLYINFSGGEPLLRPDIFELLEYASQKKLGIDLLTNGALITKDVIERLEETNIFHLQVSLDGIGKTHDQFRGINGSYERSIKAIKLLRGADYGVSISSAVTKQNIDEIPKIIDLAVDLGANLYKTTLFMPTGRGRESADSYELTSQEVKSFASMLMEKKKEIGDKITISNEEIYPWLTERTNKKNSNSFKVEDSSKIGCTAGNSSLYITPDGKITPCPFLRDFVAGDVRENDLKQIWDNSSTFNIFRNIRQGDLKGKCSHCDYLGIDCYGGCRAAAFAHSNDIYAEDPLCWKHLEQ
jgi:mycofactocin radical SAM maturase